MSISMALFFPPTPTTTAAILRDLPCLLRKQSCTQKSTLLFRHTRPSSSWSPLRVSTDTIASAATTEPKVASGEENGSVQPAFSEGEGESNVSKFVDSKWVNGTWDLTQFAKDGKTDWDAVIDAEAKRRKWLEMNPETSSNDDPVVFDTSIVPWWAWVKRYHLPEAEILNGRAAMVGFFMAYFVDSLTGAGLVDQMGNFFCKFLLLVAVVGVMSVRKNEDIETIKKLLDETTFYDKQWQAAWQDENNLEAKS